MTDKTQTAKDKHKELDSVVREAEPHIRKIPKKYEQKNGE